MNTIGVVLSAGCLGVALVELRIRADVAGRRMAAFLATAAWLTMALIAWDQHHQLRRSKDATMAATPTPAAVAVGHLVSDVGGSRHE